MVDKRKVKKRQSGDTGPRGPAGRRGKPGPPSSRDEVLAAVADQFAELRAQMDLQITRAGQIQAELDTQHRELRELRKQLADVHELLKHSLQV